MILAARRMGNSRSEATDRAVSWQSVVLVGGLIPLTTAIQRSGAADRIADVVVAVVGNTQRYLLLLAVFAITVTLGQVISNTATVLIVTPVALLVIPLVWRF